MVGCLELHRSGFEPRPTAFNQETDRVRHKISQPAKHEDHHLRQRSVELRKALLILHKALIDSERVGFEKAIGTITSPNHFFRLLTGDPWFAWLHPLSRLIVAWDEALDDAPLTVTGVDELISESGAACLSPPNMGKGFPDITMRRCSATPPSYSRTRRWSDSSVQRRRQATGRTDAPVDRRRPYPNVRPSRRPLRPDSTRGLSVVPAHAARAAVRRARPA